MSIPRQQTWMSRFVSAFRGRGNTATSATPESPVIANNRGALFAGREGVPPDYARALECFRESAASGYAPAQNNIGLMFAFGRGVLKDESEACRWFRRAAAQGDAGAQFNLGNLCHPASLGQLVSEAGEARVQAHMWFSLAAAQGYFKADASCETLNMQMSHDEINESRRRVAAFAPLKEEPSAATPL